MDGHYSKVLFCSCLMFLVGYSEEADDIVPVRLLGGSSSYNGRVEVFYNNSWVRVSAGSFTHNNKGCTTVCRQLGYSSNLAYPLTFEPESGVVWLDNVICQGGEASLGECTHYFWDQPDCDGRKDAGCHCHTGDDQDIEQETESTNDACLKASVGTGAGVLLFLLLVVVCVYIYRRQRRHVLSWLGKIHTKSDDKSMSLESLAPEESERDVKTVQEKLAELFGSTFDEDMLFKLWIPRSYVTLTKIIGNCAFGTVWKAFYNKKGKQHVVAVKSPRGPCEKGDLAILMGELRHRNVLGLLGVTFEEEVHLPLLVLPFMAHGNLQSYLRSFRFGERTGMKPHEPVQLLVFGLHIARGLKYLTSKNIVNRNIACMNCKIGANLVVKVADFGLAKDLRQNDQTKESRLPIKWLAQESLSDRIFTPHSDIWAYGVTFWEVYAMGRIPYPALDNSQMLSHLESGGRLDQPADCPDEIFSLMAQCWSAQPSGRPTFSELVKKLDEYLEAMMGFPEVNRLIYTKNIGGVKHYNVMTTLLASRQLDADIDDSDDDNDEEDDDDSDKGHDDYADTMV